MSTNNYAIQALRDEHVGMTKVENIRKSFESSTSLKPTAKEISMLHDFFSDVLIKLKDTDLSALLAKCFIEIPVNNPEVLNFLNNCSNTQWTRFNDLVDDYGNSHSRKFEIYEGEVNPKNPGECLFQTVLWLSGDEDFVEIKDENKELVPIVEAIAAKPLTMAKTAGR